MTRHNKHILSCKRHNSIWQKVWIGSNQLSQGWPKNDDFSNLSKNWWFFKFWHKLMIFSNFGQKWWISNFSQKNFGKNFGKKFEKKFEIFFEKIEKKNLKKIFEIIFFAIFDPPEPYYQRRCNFLIISGHFWVPLCYEPSRYRVRKKIPFITENGYYFNFEVNFLKRVHPYGGKNIFPQTFHLKGPWV